MSRRASRVCRSVFGRWALPGLAVLLLLIPSPARAVLDIRGRGPLMEAGRFRMRVTNAGILGNAFSNSSLSVDPSLEFPKGSGHECLEHAELWVGARTEEGSVRVSGGPMLEWRPTLAATDVVRVRNAGDRGGRPMFDDDGDGKKDEEFLDGIDNDGDGETDEDIRLPAQQTSGAVYTDDQPEALEFGYPNGEQHRPLHLKVHQELHSWVLPGLDRVAGVHFTIENTGQDRLREVYLGLYADLDSRDGLGGPGHTDDMVTMMQDSSVTFDGTTFIFGQPPFYVLSWRKDCFTRLGGTWPALHDADLETARPWVGLIGLSHTTDPLGFLVNQASAGAAQAFADARAPRRDSTMRYLVLSPSMPPRFGGPPSIDADRYAALRGDYPGVKLDSPRDYSVLVSCGPFAYLDPGQSLEFMVAFVVGTGPESLLVAAQSARVAWRGQRHDHQPNVSAASAPGFLSTRYDEGRTGITGHEICYEPPPGIEFEYDADCPSKFRTDPLFYLQDGSRPASPPVLDENHHDSSYRPGAGCVWTDFDCDICTGWDGVDEEHHWVVPYLAPGQPRQRITARDREVLIEWDDLPEILADVGIQPGGPYRFWGYRVYRLDTWRRTSLFPEAERWQQIASFGVDTSLGSRPLSEVLDPTVPVDSIAYERRHHPVGRYRFTDRRVLDGFDYHYAVTSVAVSTPPEGSTEFPVFLEGPFRTSFRDIVRPRFEAGEGGGPGRVWVVPNPYRGSAPWEREPVAGDAFTRHVDFMGLPRAQSRIRIYTLAGDLVQTIQHDGRQGDGQAAWNLISRNGQDVQAGVYLFTVDWPDGHFVGKFVLLR